MLEFRLHIFQQKCYGYFEQTVIKLTTFRIAASTVSDVNI